uniref:Uncharacterized protein n=1 Tax=Chromera velia CCMP2878 TaxID=1169474 RepID=A0A0G4I253_9ALVE|eukprot:Cvel_1702.t1-p1 / transcript=Cvel_1702.t1 / gene=Cvel_1702 / organism=Chromera_velia_CCMP2878 / gene_product=N-terminal acetyltransferase A complex subunit nat1, putative / transcript_product=N-terminal acetyltransferase A complex subunit nat1, putative / location=Cvel_scaffold61:91139-101696(-) / protein_length=1024 / sequence_SO=supercontig / SO=protein_coding / is_pseudo=false
MNAQQLPSKEHGLYRSLVKCYEGKMYKKGIKHADAVLKKFPDHGETMVMKAMCLYCIPERKGEALDLAKKGLGKNINSSSNWHCVALLHKQEKNYPEALKAIRMAMMKDPENQNLMREWGSLQAQTRQMEGYWQARMQSLKTRTNLKWHWSSLALAAFLNSNSEMSVALCQSYESQFKLKGEKKEKDPAEAWEMSEMVAFHAFVLEEAGKYTEAVELLTGDTGELCLDFVTRHETLARLKMFLGETEAAAEHFRTLFKLNPENETYVLGQMACNPSFKRFFPPLPRPAEAPPAHHDGQPNGTAASSSSSSSSGSSGSGQRAHLQFFESNFHPGGRRPAALLQPPPYLIYGVTEPSSVPESSLWPRKAKEGWKRRWTPDGSGRLGFLSLPEFPLTPDESSSLSEFLRAIEKEQLPPGAKSETARRLKLVFQNGEAFKTNLDSFLRSGLRKGIPSLFAVVKSLYSPEKIPIVTEILEGYLSCLRAEERFSPDDTNGEAGGRELPIVLPFTLTLAAQHFDHIGETDKATKLISEAIEHTPTLPELYCVAGRIWKHAGAEVMASEYFEEARGLDLADKYVNSKSAAYLARKGDTEKAEATASLFPGDRKPNFHEMQTLWFENKIGRAEFRKGDRGRSLKQLCATLRHFEEFLEDQYDFHGYCLRRGAFISYVQALRMMDRIHSHRAFRHAAKFVVKIFLSLYAEKDAAARADAAGKAGAGQGEGENGGTGVAMSAAEKKKLKAQKKREAKKQEEEAQKAEAEARNAAAAGSKKEPVDTDPSGSKLLTKSAEEDLKETRKIAVKLQTTCGLDPNSHKTAYWAFSVEGEERPLLQLKSLVRLWELGGRRRLFYKLVPCFAHFCSTVSLEEAAGSNSSASSSSSLSGALRSLVLSQVSQISGAKVSSEADVRREGKRAAEDLKAAVVKSPEGAMTEIVAAMRARCAAGSRGASEEGALLEAAGKAVQGKTVTIKEAKRALAFLKETEGWKEAADKFLAACHKRFPHADAFRDPSDVLKIVRVTGGQELSED